MNYGLYFLPANREPELITFSENEIFAAIHTEDITNKNPKFKSYYTYFQSDLNSDGIIYDVDSHIEFYKIKKERKVKLFSLF